jgi:hypothetical protein
MIMMAMTRKSAELSRYIGVPSTKDQVGEGHGVAPYVYVAADTAVVCRVIGC